jgi:EAL domain-containing protein (putative c-di-GMP-specific phosphodiesterase class I)
VIELAHRIGLRVVAEGVESESQLATLRGLGCDEVQGHVLGKPLAAAEVARWLAAPGGSPAPAGSAAGRSRRQHPRGTGSQS